MELQQIEIEIENNNNNKSQSRSFSIKSLINNQSFFFFKVQSLQDKLDPINSLIYTKTTSRFTFISR